MELNANHGQHDCLQIAINLVFYKSQAHLYRSIETEVSRRGNTKSNTKKDLVAT